MANKKTNDWIALILFFSTCPGLIRLRLSLQQSEMRFYFAASFRDEISIRQWKLLNVASTLHLNGWSSALPRAPSLCVWQFFWRLANFPFSIKTRDYQKSKWPNFRVIFFFTIQPLSCADFPSLFFSTPPGLIRIHISLCVTIFLTSDEFSIFNKKTHAYQKTQ